MALAPWTGPRLNSLARAISFPSCDQQFPLHKGHPFDDFGVLTPLVSLLNIYLRRLAQVRPLLSQTLPPDGDDSADCWKLLTVAAFMKIINSRGTGTNQRGRRSTCGFSMIEMVVVLAIIMVMLGITFISLQPALKEAHATNAYDVVLSQIRAARSRAVETRQQYVVCLGATTPAGAATPLGAPTAQSVQIFQWPAGAALSSATQVSKVDLPSDVQFQTLVGLPAAAPDGFGSGTVAIDFDQNVAAAIKNQIMFLPDGSARDTAGNLSSGIVYVAGTSLDSTRAITIWGASGRIRGWRLGNLAGPAPWIQQ